jgi:hypothetical protein
VNKQEEKRLQRQSDEDSAAIDWPLLREQVEAGLFRPPPSWYEEEWES